MTACLAGEVRDLAGNSARNAALAEQGSSASMSLHPQAGGLMQAVSVFKVAAR